MAVPLFVLPILVMATWTRGRSGAPLFARCNLSLLGRCDLTSSRLETNREELDELTSIPVVVELLLVRLLLRCGGATANGSWLRLLRHLMWVLSRLSLLRIGRTGSVHVRLLLLNCIGVLVNSVSFGMKCTIALVSL